MKTYYCRECKEFYTRSGFGTHRRKHHGKKLIFKRNKRFKCTLCSSKFYYKIALNKHNQDVHEKEETSVNITYNEIDSMYICGICNSAFSRKVKLNTHQKQHYAEFASMVASSASDEETITVKMEPI